MVDDGGRPAFRWGVLGGRLVEVIRARRRNGADGYDVISTTGDPGSRTAYTTFAQDWCVRQVEVGVTVCPHPAGTHWCGLVHLSAYQAKSAGVELVDPGC